MHLISFRREKSRRFRKMSENGGKKGLTTRLGYDMIKNNLGDAPCAKKGFGETAEGGTAWGRKGFDGDCEAR